MTCTIFLLKSKRTSSVKEECKKRNNWKCTRYLEGVFFPLLFFSLSKIGVSVNHCFVVVDKDYEASVQPHLPNF